MRGRRTAERERRDEIEQEGFVPRGAWRDPEARVAAMQHVALVKLLLGRPMCRITR